jgi:arylsulfatase A-like enzyme
VKGLVDLTDLTSTVADVFGTGAPTFRGRSLLPILAGAPAKEALVARTAEDQPKYAVRHGRFALVYHTARGDTEVYDLEADPGQQRNIAGDQPVRASFYRQALFRFLVDARHGPRAVAEEVKLTEEQKENLKALGYVH